jgi:hypothetical protein
MRSLVLCCFFIHSLFLVAQTRSLTGVVADSLQVPLENANIIAKPLAEGANLRFAISDHKGRYRLVLDANIAYEITLSYLGYKDQMVKIVPQDGRETLNFVMQESGEQLDEITLTHEFKPVIVKKDTVSYDVASFASGNERKMKEILEKLPGVEVDKNGGVTFQGRKINKMLVENKPFFGGGSKLAVENIPADALDKIEVIDDYNEVSLLKNVNDSDQLAMNVKLKEDKKKFVFGDLEAAAGNDEHYNAHAALFYYSPKTNVSFIGNLNDVGKETFSFSDFMRFEGGISNLLRNTRSFSSGLRLFMNANRDVAETNSEFAAINIDQEINDKFSVSGYMLFSKNRLRTASQTFNRFFLPDTTQTEDRQNTGTKRNLLGVAKARLTYTPNRNSEWYYDVNIKASDNESADRLSVFDGLNTTQFNTFRDAGSLNATQFLEWHRSANPNKTTSLVVNHIFERTTPDNQWIVDRPFLAGFIPLIDDETFNVKQVKEESSNYFDVLYKHYWIINGDNHLYFNVGNTFSDDYLQTSENQLLSDGSINSFETADFGNDLRLRQNDLFAGLEYKFRWGISTHTAGIFLHRYYWETRQNNGNTSAQTWRLQPEWTSNIEFNNAEKLVFKYKLNNSLPQAENFVGNFTLQSYNFVFRGNPTLKQERFHTLALNYNKTSIYRGIMLFANLNYNHKEKSIRQQTEQEGINRFNTPVFTDNPENNWSFNANLRKVIYKFTATLNSRWNHSDYIQNINNNRTENTSVNTTLGGSLKTNFKKIPTLKAGFQRSWNSFASDLNLSRFRNDLFEAEIEYDFLKVFTLRADYEATKNRNILSQQNVRFETGNASLSYKKENSPWSFDLSVNNFINNASRNTNSFSDLLVTEQSTFILPRIWLFTVRYKL